MLICAINMLKYINEDAAAQKIEKALYKVLAENKNLTCDLGGSASTTQFTQEIINNL